MAEMKTLNGYEIVDAKARQDIEVLNNKEVDLTGYATETYVQNAINSIEFPEPNLTEYALKVEIPTKVSSLENDKDFVDKAFVNKAIEDIDIPETDLTGYAKEQWVKNQGYITSIPSEYVTENELNAYALKSDIPTVPKNISAFTNDVKYATEVYVGSEIAKAQLAGKDVDLSSYYTKDEVDALIPNVDNFITEIPSEYITETELNAKGYLTQHQSLDNYATKKYVDDAIAGIDIPEGGEVTVDLSNYYTRSQVDALIPKDYITNIPDEYVTENELKNYATEDYVDNKFNGANQALSYFDYSSMVSAFNDVTNEAFDIGRNIMIVTLNVPDLWISDIEPTKETYTYTDDTAIVNTLKTYGRIKIGYYVLSPLETQKVDLTSYATKSYVLDSIFNEANNINTQANSIIMDGYTRTDARTNLYETVYPVTEIYQLTDNTYYGHSTQFKTGDTCTVRENSSCKWVGDDCVDGIFTPKANTNYEVYSYYNSGIAKTVNMVMNLGA